MHCSYAFCWATFPLREDLQISSKPAAKALVCFEKKQEWVRVRVRELQDTSFLVQEPFLGSRVAHKKISLGRSQPKSGYELALYLVT